VDCAAYPRVRVRCGAGGHRAGRKAGPSDLPSRRRPATWGTRPATAPATLSTLVTEMEAAPTRKPQLLTRVPTDRRLNTDYDMTLQ
jgi:hypothetical protein